MNSMIRCMIITPIDMSEEYYTGNMMDMSMKIFVAKEGNINVGFSETFNAEATNEDYLNNAAYPNAAEPSSDKKDLWMSMFSRHQRIADEDEDESIYICAD